MIRLTGLTKCYRRHRAEFWALGGVDLEVRPGELFGLLGPNGAGKTTTMMILAGLIKATSGRAQIAGFDVAHQGRQAKQRLGYVPDRPYVYEKLTGRELLALFADLYDMPRHTAVTESLRWLDVFGLTTHADELIESYSHGMKQRVVLAATLLHDPEVMIVDEPMVGLDPQGARLFKDLMRQRCRAGRTVLMSTHTLEVAEGMCDRVGILHRGKLLTVGTVDELRREAARDDASLEELFLTLTKQADGAASDNLPRYDRGQS